MGRAIRRRQACLERRSGTGRRLCGRHDPGDPISVATRCRWCGCQRGDSVHGFATTPVCRLL